MKWEHCWVACAALLLLVVLSGWVTEDAYITLRTIDNWVNGHGLRWNIDERVQSYTHPLWMVVLAVAYLPTRQAFVATLLMSCLFTVLAIVLLVRLGRTAGHALAAVAFLSLSRAFVDFSTSGLENPLSHFLLALFAYSYFARPFDILSQYFLAALLSLCRTDAFLLVMPALLHIGLASIQQKGIFSTARAALFGLTPFWAWLFFSLFYYGFPVANTAYAKLGTGIAWNELSRQGWRYVLYSAVWDPPLFGVIVLAILPAFYARQVRHSMFAFGLLCYLGYVVSIGGDFMLGRFLTVPLFGATCLIAVSSLTLQKPAVLASAVCPIAALAVVRAFGLAYDGTFDTRGGIVDERAEYQNELTLVSNGALLTTPNHRWVDEGRELRLRHQRTYVAAAVGLRGFYAGPNVHIVDKLALTEPLLARLPALHDTHWRVGHYTRRIPDGFLDTIESSECRMKDQGLCLYYAKLKLITSGDLCSVLRLRAIVAMNLGMYDNWLDTYRNENLTPWHNSH